MLSNARNFKRIYIATGYTDLYRGIEGLAGIIRFQFHLEPYDVNTIFLFCSKRCDRLKALFWEGDGFLLCYKRVDNGSFNWSRYANEAIKISAEQYRALMQGMEVFAKRPIETIKTVPSIM